MWTWKIMSNGLQTGPKNTELVCKKLKQKKEIKYKKQQIMFCNCTRKHFMYLSDPCDQPLIQNVPASEKLDPYFGRWWTDLLFSI